jgi:cobyrinic acid a,c-diamide synthase
MCGVLDTDAAMTSQLTLGYREATAMTDSVLAVAGTVVRGHEFHRTRCTPSSPVQEPTSGSAGGASIVGRPASAWRWSSPGGGDRVEGFVAGRVHASYLHLHWAGVPGAANNLVGAARQAVKVDV